MNSLTGFVVSRRIKLKDKLKILKKEDVRGLESCEMWLWRKVLNISWSDKVCNEELLRCIGGERTIISVIKRRQNLAWLLFTSHRSPLSERLEQANTLWHGDIVSVVIEGRITGKRPHGRPRDGMLNRVKDGSLYVAVKRRALDREL